jgi:predicted acylesterase/phospholipase RssA
MSGGGTKGAYEAGAMWGMYNTIADKTKLQYDVVTGVSAGSINTMLVAMYGKGEEEAMLKDMSTRWASLKQDDLYVQWSPLGMVTGIASETGVLNTAPLGDYFNNFIELHNYEFKRQFAMSVVDVNTGTYRVWDETISKDIVKVVLSSSAIPFVFPNQKWDDGSVMMDGGTVWNTNIISAIQKCRAHVDDDSQINVDIITC